MRLLLVSFEGLLLPPIQDENCMGTSVRGIALPRLSMVWAFSFLK